MELLQLNRKNFICFEKGGISLTFLQSGDIFEIAARHILINQIQGNSATGSLSNVYLRVKSGQTQKVCALKGMASDSSMLIGDSGIQYSGSFEGVEYQLKTVLSSQNIWFDCVVLDCKDKNKQYDLFFAQDVGLSSRGSVLSNELFVSQYLDRKVIKTENGYTIACRQNQNQNGFPYLQTGFLKGNAAHYSTDAMQFYDKQYKLTSAIAAFEGDLADENYQFELSFSALQTEKMNGRSEVVAYNYYSPDHPLKIEELVEKRTIENAFHEVDLTFTGAKAFSPAKPAISYDDTFASPAFDSAELKAMFPQMRFEEYSSSDLLSFFTPSDEHVVLQKKEVLCERPHGHILFTIPDIDKTPSNLLTTTNYMTGIFNCQTVCGNTSMQKLLSVSRGLLNNSRSGGQRIFVKIDGKFRLLTMPAAYMMGFNYSKWFYKIAGDLLTVTSFSHARNAGMTLKIESKNKVKYEFIVTNRIVMGENEFSQPVSLAQKDNLFIFKSGNVNNNTVYPDITYILTIEGAAFTYGGDKILYADKACCDDTLLCISLQQTDKFIINTYADINGKIDPAPAGFEEEKAKYEKFFTNLLDNFSLSGIKNERIDKLNTLSKWVSHNAMVHFAVPHGLEQCGGAAWGTRDVCQGPVEYFLATGHYNAVRNIILELFNNLLEQTHEWPQWFMFDKYPYHADDCHGDVVFWPLKALCDYLEKTGDHSVLDEKINNKNGKTIEALLKEAVETIFERFIGGTGLITYAGGDWDDTLQPVSESLKKNLVSSWTVSLAFQTFTLLSKTFSGRDNAYSDKMLAAAGKIRQSFEKHLIKDGIIAGFGYINNNKVELLLHPDDTMTGIEYRLLPMTRSIIAGLATPRQAELNCKTIESKLKCPDGVRLMDKPARYSGGESHIFVRAETAANVGREISLQYTHAHIRYIEAMSKLGKADQAWDALFVINPIKIQSEVKNAALRQSNTYFSSSEGMFKDRYDFAKNYKLLKNGEIGVKGGWRIYSSGSGIYMNQLISAVLGFRQKTSGIEFDPALPSSVNGLVLNINYNDFKLKIKYMIKSSRPASVKKVIINGKTAKTKDIANPYRKGGKFVAKEILDSLLIIGEPNNIELVIK